MTKAQKHLPFWLTGGLSLQEVRRDTDQVLMKLKSLDDKHQKWVIRTLEEAIVENEDWLKTFTGHASQQKLDRLCELDYGRRHQISRPHLNVFEMVWPFKRLHVRMDL